MGERLRHVSEMFDGQMAESYALTQNLHIYVYIYAISLLGRPKRVSAVGDHSKNNLYYFCDKNNNQLINSIILIVWFKKQNEATLIFYNRKKKCSGEIEIYCTDCYLYSIMIFLFLRLSFPYFFTDLNCLQFYSFINSNFSQFQVYKLNNKNRIRDETPNVTFLARSSSSVRKKEY